jgi:hypothetical protein
MSPAGIEVLDKMGRRQKLKTLCETRWASRHTPYSHFCQHFRLLLKVLQREEPEAVILIAHQQVKQ